MKQAPSKGLKVLDRIEFRDNRAEKNDFSEGQLKEFGLQARLAYLLKKKTGAKWEFVIFDDKDSEIRLCTGNMFNSIKDADYAVDCMKRYFPVTLSKQAVSEKIPHTFYSQALLYAGESRFDIKFSSPALSEACLLELKDAENVKYAFKTAAYDLDNLEKPKATYCILQ